MRLHPGAGTCIAALAGMIAAMTYGPFCTRIKWMPAHGSPAASSSATPQPGCAWEGAESLHAHHDAQERAAITDASFLVARDRKVHERLCQRAHYAVTGGEQRDDQVRFSLCAISPKK